MWVCKGDFWKSQNSTTKKRDPLMVDHPWLFLPPLLDSPPRDLCWGEPIANGPKQDTTRKDEMKPVKQWWEKNGKHMNMSTTWCDFSSKSATLPATWFQIFAYLPNFRKDGSRRTQQLTPQAQVIPALLKTNPTQVVPHVLHTGTAKVERMKRFFPPSVISQIAVDQKSWKNPEPLRLQWQQKYLHELWNPGWLIEALTDNGWIEMLYLHM